MSHRLQVLIPKDLDARLSKAAELRRMSKAEWVRRALEDSLRRSAETDDARDPLDRLRTLAAPTADIQQMIAEIDAGRS